MRPGLYRTTKYVSCETGFTVRLWEGGSMFFLPPDTVVLLVGSKETSDEDVACHLLGPLGLCTAISHPQWMHEALEPL